MIFGQTCLVEYLLDVFHSVGARIRRDRARLPDGVDVTHVSNRWGDDLFMISNSVVDLLVGGVGLGNQVVLELVRVVRASCMISRLLPKWPKRAMGLLINDLKCCITNYYTNAFSLKARFNAILHHHHFPQRSRILATTWLFFKLPSTLGSLDKNSSLARWSATLRASICSPVSFTIFF